MATRTTTSSQSFAKRSSKGSASGNLLRRLPESLAIKLMRAPESENIDDIENKCEAKVLIIVMEKNIMIENADFAEYIQKDQDFHHIALPTFDVIEKPKSLSNLKTKNYRNNIPDYVQLCKIIDENFYDYDGFVVIEDVSKLSYASSFMSFMLQNLSKSVVFTSSTTKLNDCFNDAKSNLLSSLIVAGRSDICEVSICFNRKVYRGNRAIRNDQSSHHAFDSPNFSLLAEFGTALIIHKNLLIPTSKKGFRTFTKMFKDIIVIYLTPVMSLQLMRFLLCSKRKKGIVISLYGAGNAPQSKQLKEIFTECINKYQCNIVITTQCLKGHVNMSVYATGNFFSDIGLIDGGDMTIEACVAKLSYLMGKGLSKTEMKQRFETNLVGERTPTHSIQGRIVDFKNAHGDHHGVDEQIIDDTVRV